MDFINDCVALIPKTKKKWVDSGISLNRRPDFMQRNIKTTNSKNRPFDVNSAIQLIVAKPHDYSFPSGHTAASFTAVMALYLAGEKKLWKIALVLAVLICIFKTLFICSLSNRRIRWNHNWSYCRLHRIQTNFYCPVKAQKEAVNGSSRLQLFSSVFLNKKVS